jgi:predicted nucleotidyltransferase
MRPSEALARHRDQVIEIISRYPVSNPRIFGSVARGEDGEGSDLDILVHPEAVMSYYELAKLSLELERLLGCRVDVGEDDVIRSNAEGSVLMEARAL